MCGRFSLKTPSKVLAKAFKIEVPTLPLRYNIAPTQQVAAVRSRPDGRELALLKWGLVPSWAKDASIGSRMINARAETVAEKPAYRWAFRRRRCLVPADGFYEWKREGGSKQPYHFRMRDEQPFAFAGLWERWRGELGEVIDSCTIITTEANELLAPVHDRMPVILPPEAYDTWLDDEFTDALALGGLLRPYPAEAMERFPVSTRVNSPKNDDASCVAIQAL